MKTKKIIWVSHSSKASGGGELSLLTATKVALSRGYEPIIVVPSPGDMQKRARELGVKTYIVRFSWWNRGDQTHFHKIILNASATKKMQRIFEAEKPLTVITNTMVTPWGALAARATNTPHVWHIRELGRADHNLRFLLGEKLTYRVIDSTADHIIANSLSVKKHLHSVLSSPIVVSYPYVKVPNLRKSKHSQKPKTTIDLIVVGGVAEGKGQLDAIKGMNIAQGLVTSKKLRLTLVGPYSKPYRQKIEDYISNAKNITQSQVIFLGKKDNPYTYLQKSDMYIMCSKNEAFGRVTIEAMASSLPVIGTSTGGTPEIVEDGVTGFLYQRDQIKQLGELIARLSSDLGQAQKMGRAGKQRVSKKFNETSCLDPLFETVESVKCTHSKSPIRNRATIAAIFFTSLSVVTAKKTVAVTRLVSKKARIGLSRILKMLFKLKRMVLRLASKIKRRILK